MTRQRALLSDRTPSLSFGRDSDARHVRIVALVVSETFEVAHQAAISGP
jgi:hypothetical protein